MGYDVKILQTVFDIMDYGGIVNHVELLAKGFERLGHTSKMTILRNSTQPPKLTKLETHVAGTYGSRTANQVNTITGWYGAQSYSYGDKTQLQNWRRFAEKFDLVIHQLPVPKADAEGWWRKLYDIDVPQIAIAHDAHFRHAYPHMIEIADKLVGVSVTNPAGYHALEWLPAPRCFIGAPHVPRKWHQQKEWRDRPKRFVSAHVWKAWKHMDLVLRALPHIEKGIDNFIGGDGIEARYMRSKDKCKPKYKGLWRSAEKAGMNYAGLVSPRAIMQEYTHSRAMVDMSFSKKFAQLGNHFNRSTIEAYNGGCVPLVVKENMRDDTGIFKRNVHYLAIPYTVACKPKMLANAIEDAVMNVHANDAEYIVDNGRRLLKKHFDYRHSADEFIRLAKGKKNIGIYSKLERGKLNREIKERRDALLRSVEK